ncbi:MAG: DUF4105 domain-containing protein [Bacteriovoracaceae bacterium]|nr:DUF4105 domain-containing protein [Bacteriovoracaceae bacterium]
MIRAFFILNILIFSCSVFSASSKEFNQLIKTGLNNSAHLDAQWLNALHYKKTLFGGFQSEADSKSFFFAKDGEDNSKSEMQATILALLEGKPSDINQHAQCRFPTRTKIIKRLFPDLANNLKIVCPQFEEFKKKLSAKAVSIVFSSYYLDTPASAFGHTLMRFSKYADPKEGESFELLDNAVNYSANVTTNNALIYGLLGLSGGFKGEFAFMPYFYKVREYNDFESRDIWDYHLNLNQEQIDTVVTHVWEMKQTYFAYWYLTENCSYHMLSLLDVANPNWRLAERNPYFVVPVDTIQTVKDTPNLLKTVSFRPSKRRVIKSRLEKMSSEEKSSFDQMAKDFTKPFDDEGLSEKSKANVLDAAMDFLDYKYAEEILMNNSTPSAWKRKFLIARSKISIKSKEVQIPFPTKEQPQLGHRSRRIAIGGGKASESDAFGLFEYRFTLHDLLDNPIGHNKDAWMEMGNFKFRYHPKVESKGDSSMFRLDDFSLFHVLSLSPLQEYFSTMTWTARLGAKTIKDEGCSYCFTPMMRIGGGLSQDFNWLVYYVLLSTEAEAWKNIGDKGYRFGAGPEGGIVLRFTDKFQAFLKGEYIRRFFTDHEWTYEYSGSLRMELFENNSLETSYTRFEREGEALVKYLLYF